MADEQQVSEPEAFDVDAKERFDAAEDQLMSLELEEDVRPRQYAIIFTCFLFIFLFLVTLPEGETQVFEENVIFMPEIDVFIPEMKEPPKVEKKELENVKKVILPDPTPEEPEPIKEPIPEPPPEPLPPNVVVRRGLPRGPPKKGGGPVREGMAGLTNPVIIKDVKPDYPTAARRAGVGGTVHLRAIVGTDGKVKSVQLLKGIGKFGLDEAAVEAAKKRIYEPGVLEGKPVEVITTIRINYFLQ